MFCCPGFETLINDFGRRGMYVVIKKDDKNIIFFLAFQAFSVADESLIKKNKPKFPVNENITLGGNMRINYCPICGTKLSSLIDNSNKKIYESLAEKHSIFE